MDSGAIEKFIDSIKEPEVGTNRTNLAVVSRVDEEGIVWVNLAGAEKETPTASTSAEVKSGDVVNVEWRNNKLYIAGNYTNPSAGVIEVRHVVQVVGDVQQTADDAKETALQTKKVTEQVKKIADNTNQYFWHTEEGTDTGAHITEIPQEDFIADPDNGGGNLLARSNGIAVRDGLAELAVFGADGSQIGQTGKSHIEMDYHSLQMVDGDTNPHVFFHISDLRDKNNEYRYTEKFTGTGYTTRFSLSFRAKRDKELSVTVSDGSGGEAYLDSSNAYWLRFETAPTAGAIITVSYTTDSYYAKAYTLGVRKNNSDIGPLSACFGLNNIASGDRSFAEGWDTKATGTCSHSEGYGSKASGSKSHAEGETTIASGTYSHAEGDSSIASGSCSHAEGSSTASGQYAHSEGDETVASGSRSHAQNSNTIAGYSNQTVIGKYNDNLSTDLFEIGNGSSSSRSNAMEVTTTGDTTIAGRLTQSSDRRLKDHVSYLGDDAVDFISDLKPAHFIKDGKHHVGFYAQDVESADKWHCMTGEMNGFKTLGYTELIAPLVTYCQKLELRIEQLENKLKEER